jgi:tetratricopeptide (TPR) repeat protein
MRSNTKNADLYYNLALCYHRMGKANEEEKTVDIGRKIDPEHTGLKNLLGLSALDKGNTDEAIEVLADLPDEPIFQWNLALAYARKGDLKKSQEYYKRIVTGQVDVGWSNEAARRIDELNKKIKEQDETIENHEKLIRERSSGLRIVGWSSLVAAVLLLVGTGYYMVSKRLTPLLRSIPGDQKEKLAFFGPIIVAIITLAGNVLVAVIK